MIRASGAPGTQSPAIAPRPALETATLSATTTFSDCRRPTAAWVRRGVARRHAATAPRVCAHAAQQTELGAATLAPYNMRRPHSSLDRRPLISRAHNLSG